ncbi:hypothetical protein [Bacillus thuringiensis]|uniref:CdiA C-terminal domain-containing protein n=1 Tax=Bacillus thuringiensis TaxID=1428 RepID=UPI000BEC76A2|nr:hypothetical protein [Bacillus thuringiensis]PEE68588.1 hypothetical protein COM73_23550 [Bacillus thuringiensis]
MSYDLQIELRPIVPYMMLALKNIRKLSAGITDRQETPPPTVPRENMEAALMLAENIEDTLLNFSVRLDVVRKGWAGPVAEMIYGQALSGAQGIRRTLATQLEHVSGTDIKPINIHTLINYDNRFNGSQDILMVMSGEVSWNDSFLGSIHTGFSEYVDTLTDIAISSIPVIGPIYDISTGIIGIRLPDGHKLSNLDRILRIIFSSAGILLGAITKGGRVTINLVRTVSKARVIRNQKLALAVALNKMTPKQLEHFGTVIKAAQSGVKLTHEQQILLNKLLVSMNQTGIAVDWAKLAEHSWNIREKIESALVFKNVVFKEGEKEAVKVLTQKLNKTSIIALPESLPVDFMEKSYLALPKLKMTEGIRHPDLLIENILADIYTPRTDNFKSILKMFELKNSQATMIVLNMDKSPLPPQEAVKQMGRLWGKIEALSIDRVIVLNSKGFFEYLTRPIPFRMTDLGLFPTSVIANLKQLWDELEKEDK